MVLEGQRTTEAMVNGRGLELTNKARDEVMRSARFCFVLYLSGGEG